MGFINKTFLFKFIVIKHDAPVKETVDFLYSTIELPKPKMILSVTGGAKKFQVAENIKNAFKTGLMEAAKTTDSWIISGGTDVGVMRLVGEAIEENPHAQDLVVLGIASYKRIDPEYRIIGKSVRKNKRCLFKN